MTFPGNNELAPHVSDPMAPKRSPGVAAHEPRVGVGKRGPSRWRQQAPHVGVRLVAQPRHVAPPADDCDAGTGHASGTECRRWRWSGRTVLSILAPDPDHEFPRHRIPVLVAKGVDRGQVFGAHGVLDLRVKTGIGQGYRATFEGCAAGGGG